MEPILSKSSRIFVAGHRGMVGSAIVRQLQSQGFDHIITRTHGELDLTNQQAVRDFFQNQTINHVVLAAAKVGGIHANSKFPAEFIYQNIIIEANVIHEAYQAGIQRLLFLGSSCIYPKHAPQPLKEAYLLTGPLEASNEPYAVAKIAGMKLCEYYNRQYGTHFRSVMPTNLYGPNDNFDLEQSHVLPALIRKFHLAKLAQQRDWKAIKKDEDFFGPIPENVKTAFNIPLIESPPVRSGQHHQHLAEPAVILWGSGSPRREFLQVDDLAEACIFLMGINDEDFTAALSSPSNTHTIQSSYLSSMNIGCGEDLTIRELAALVAEIVGYNGQIIWDYEKPDGTPRKLLDISRLSRLGWKPKIPLKTGIKHAYRSYLDQVK